MTQITTCNPCCEPQLLARTEQTFRPSVLQVLCNLYGIIAEGIPVIIGDVVLASQPNPFTTPLPIEGEVTVTNTVTDMQYEFIQTGFAGITTAAYLLVLAAPTSPYKIIVLDNTTDTDVLVSFDIGVTFIKVYKGQSKEMELNANGMQFNSPISLKASGSNATSGEFFITGFF